MDKNKEKSRFNSILKIIWIVAGILLILALIEGLSILIAVKEYFP